MLTRIPLFILVLFVTQVGFAEGKGYEFAHGYDPDEKYGDTSVHFDNMAGLRYECVQDIQKQIISVFEEHLNGKEVMFFCTLHFIYYLNLRTLSLPHILHWSLSVHTVDWVRRSSSQS